jgi:hypothetical protein
MIDCCPRSSSAQLKKVSINEESSPVVRRDQTVSPCNGERLRNDLKVNKNITNPGANNNFLYKKKGVELKIFLSVYCRIMGIPSRDFNFSKNNFFLNFSK